MLKEFKPALRFVAIFIAVYLVLNFVYGFWIESVRPSPDRATILVTQQTSVFLSAIGEDVQGRIDVKTPTVSVLKKGDIVLRVYEGCNGINVMIVFISFLLAFSGGKKKIIWFLPLGLFIIHLANLIRIALLYYVAEYWQSYFYYVHKYLFTAVIYLVVFLLWWVWVEKIVGSGLKGALTSNKDS